MSNTLESFDQYLKSEIDDLELTPSKNFWNGVEQKMERNAVAKKAGTIRRLRLSLSVIGAAFGLFVAYHYYNQSPAKAHAQPNSETLAAPSSPEKTVNEAPASLTEVQMPAGARAKEAAKQPATVQKKTTRPEKNSVTQEIPSLDIQPVTSDKDKAAKLPEPDKITVLKYVFAADPKDQSPVLPETPAIDYQNDTEQPSTAPVPEKAIFVPNAFTPNGDGLNDIFMPTASEDPKEYKLSIYDRNGKLVFLTDNFKTGWDGRINNGGAESVREDIYIWRIEMKNAKGDKEQLMGSLTLLK